MHRTIKRYGSRKLYDPEGSQYVSMSDLATWIRKGDEVSVLDNTTGEDVTAQVLTQVIAEEGRSGRVFSTSVLHDLLRVGEEAFRRGEDVVAQGVREVKESVGGLVQRTTGRRPADAPAEPKAEATPPQGEMQRLRARLDALEKSLHDLRKDANS